MLLSISASILLDLRYCGNGLLQDLVLLRAAVRLIISFFSDHWLYATLATMLLFTSTTSTIAMAAYVFDGQCIRSLWKRQRTIGRRSPPFPLPILLSF
jgi:hypothetical protein